MLSNADGLLSFGPNREWQCIRCGAIVIAPMPCICGDCGRADDERREREAIEQRMGQIFPRRLRWADFESPLYLQRVADAKRVMEEARQALDALTSDDCIAVDLTGPAGVGKTATACAMLREWSRRGNTGMYVAAVDLANARRDAGFGDTPETIERAVRSGLLILDDLGQEHQSEPCRAALREVVWSRYDAARPTIYTIARHEDWVQQAYGDGFARRMYEDAIEIAWPWEAK